MVPLTGFSSCRPGVNALCSYLQTGNCFAEAVDLDLSWYSRAEQGDAGSGLKAAAHGLPVR